MQLSQALVSKQMADEWHMESWTACVLMIERACCSSLLFCRNVGLAPEVHDAVPACVAGCGHGSNGHVQFIAKYVYDGSAHTVTFVRAHASLRAITTLLRLPSMSGHIACACMHDDLVLCVQLTCDNNVRHRS